MLNLLLLSMDMKLEIAMATKEMAMATKEMAMHTKEMVMHTKEMYINPSQFSFQWGIGISAVLLITFFFF